MKKLIQGLLILVLIITVSACASNDDPTQKPPGFLPNYAQLKQVPNSPDDTKMYVYKNPKAKRSDYHAGIVESVILYQNATESGIKESQIQAVRDGIDKGIKRIVSNKISLVNESGPGVFRLQVAITGATVQKDGLKPWNIIPISAAIKLASMATGLDGKKPVLVVELKFTDSQSGKLLKEIVTVITGSSFHLEGNKAEAFQELATKWVKEGLEYSN